MNTEIYQYFEMGANITGTIITDTSYLIYRDNSHNIGAYFIFPNSDPPLDLDAPGFISGLLLPGFYLRSTDFPANSNFKLVFKISGYNDLEPCNNCN
jgi:hypothetical protein